MSYFYYDRFLEDDSRTIRLIKEDAEGKNAEVLIKGFLKDIPRINITNNWSDASSSIISSLVDMVGGMTNSAIGRRVAGSIPTIVDELPFLSDGVKAGVKSAVKSYERFNNSYVTAVENMVKTYRGTTVNVNASELAIILLNDTISKDAKAEVDKLVLASTGNFDGVWNGIAGIQSPPNGYYVDYEKALVGKLKGTFRLDIGKVMSLTNILVSSIDYGVSPMCCMDAEGKSTNKPLYIELVVNFEFARILSPNEINSLTQITK